MIELCPVGALTSTQYRFEGRPWEIQNVPTVCGLCPVGCNISATTREGKVKRILSRNHPEVDEGWLCDKGRFAYSHLQRRRPDPAIRSRQPARRLRAARVDGGARPRPSGMLRAAGTAIVTALSGSETVEQAYGLARAPARRPRRPRSGAARGRPRRARRLPRAALGDPRRADRRRPLRRAGRRAGAGRRPLDQGGAAQRRPRASPSCPTTPVEGAVLISDDAADRRLARPRARRRGRLLPAAHAERPRRHRRLELRRRRRAERRASRRSLDHLRRRGRRRSGRPRARRARRAR